MNSNYENILNTAPVLGNSSTNLRKKLPIYKRTWFIILMVLIGLGALVGICYGIVASNIEYYNSNCNAIHNWGSNNNKHVTK